ncbi:MAG TPA: hypothetical protein VKE70_23545, partial [Candidatus Solibacter sp.]|nr:hypothetical protein [Candidatus Solibacter sp.]
MQQKSLLGAALFAALPVLCTAQQQPAATPLANPNPPSVYSNPRSASDDPRIGLKGGLYDAGEAAFGMEKVATLPKPTGFAPGSDATATTPPPEPPPEQGLPAGGRGAQQRPGISYGSTNSDLAFSGHHLFVGNYNGINFYDIDSPAKIKLRTSILCPGGQGDVSVYKHLLFMSAEAMNGRLDCGVQGNPPPPGYVPPPPPPAPANGGRAPRVPPPPSPDRFRGVRIFDISDLANPK